MPLRSQHGLHLVSPIPRLEKKDHILLVGSVATHSALKKYVDLVLSDKLVPSAILQLIPDRVELRISRKFPGNAVGAQTDVVYQLCEYVSTSVILCQVSLNILIAKTRRPVNIWPSESDQGFIIAI